MQQINAITNQDLVTLAQAKNLTITPNNRTAINLSKRVVSFVLDETNSTACLTPNIYPLSKWVANLFADLRSENVAPFSTLSLIAENDLVSYWIKVMHFDPLSESLVNPSEWLSDVMSADKALSRWQVTEYTPDSSLSQSFKRWRGKVYSELKSKGFVTQSNAIELIIDAIKTKKVRIPQNVFLYAFDELPPLYKSLFDAIQEQSTLTELKPVKESARWLTVATDNQECQLDTVARWASKVIDNEPTKTICIVSPDLKENRKAIVKSLNNIFEPQSILPQNGTFTAPYDVSLGVTLSDIPLFSRALYYLSIQNGVVPAEHVLNIVKDPFTTGNKSELRQRRKFANSLRDNRGIKTSLNSLAMKSGCPSKLSSSLNVFVTTLSQHPEVMLPSRWGQLFHNALSALGWAKGIYLNEVELGAVDKWKDVLDSLSCLDMHTGEITKELALKILKQYSNNTLVTPAQKNSPISVMGTLEAAGLDFSYIWVLDCNNSVFPAPASLNSCLPTKLQIEKKMPHSSGEREYEFTQQLFSRYRGSCNELYTSYIMNDANGPKKKASILDLAHAAVEPEKIIDLDIINYKQITFKQFSVNELRDTIGKMSLKANTVPGGVAVLDLMEQCPMQAITNHRLKVSNHTPNYTMGLTGAERGEIMHNALECFWGDVCKLRLKEKNDNDTLLSLEQAELNNLLEEAVEVGFFWLDRVDIDSALIEQERSMMLSTLKQWIEVEKARQPFNVIALEKSDFIELGGYKLKIRKDRVDEVIVSQNNHKKLALDNKSREESIGGAFSKSTPKSQLPLAAISENADGMAYLNVIAHTPSISGVIDTELSNDFQALSKHRYNAPKDWGQLKKMWLDKFSNKIAQYVEGEALYTPSTQACMYCVKKSLCKYSVG